jgi:G:T-mismatch repair DNA endonuclease (very short patch repair protein)
MSRTLDPALEPAPVFGKPDFIFVQAKLAVFVDGC